MGRIDGKVALITGTGTGIGRACQVLFAQEGARTVGVSRTQGNLDETLAEVRAAGAEGLAVAADLSTEEGARQAVDATLEAHGRIDILVAAAGVGANFKVAEGAMADTINLPPDLWREVLVLNADTMFHTYRAVVPQMIEQGGGSIIGLASLASDASTAAGHAYSASKATALSLTRSIAVTYAQQGVRANAVAPGWIETQMVSDYLPLLFGTPEAAAAVNPMARFGQPFEAAAACLFFASDESSFCNGALLHVDGGQSAKM